MTLSADTSTIADAGANVTGVSSSFDHDKIPSSILAAQLPALLHFPAGGVREQSTFGHGMWQIRHNVRVRLCYTPAASGRLEDNIAGIVTMIDNYMAEMQDSTLPTNFQFDNYGEPGTFDFAGVGYHGCDFLVSFVEYIT